MILSPFFKLRCLVNGIMFFQLKQTIQSSYALRSNELIGMVWSICQYVPWLAQFMSSSKFHSSHFMNKETSVPRYSAPLLVFFIFIVIKHFMSLFLAPCARICTITTFVSIFSGFLDQAELSNRHDDMALPALFAVGHDLTIPIYSSKT